MTSANVRSHLPSVCEALRGAHERARSNLRMLRLLDSTRPVDGPWHRPSGTARRGRRW
jgi:hypothetical protein